MNLVTVNHVVQQSICYYHFKRILMRILRQFLTGWTVCGVHEICDGRSQYHRNNVCYTFCSGSLCFLQNYLQQVSYNMLLLGMVQKLKLSIVLSVSKSRKSYVYECLNYTYSYVFEYILLTVMSILMLNVTHFSELRPGDRLRFELC